jgi:hypothetical protein
MKVLKIKSVLSVYAPIVLTFLAALLWRKEKMKFWLASMKTLTNCKNPSSNPLQTACCGIDEPAYDSVSCSVSRRQELYSTFRDIEDAKKFKNHRRIYRKY